MKENSALSDRESPTVPLLPCPFDCDTHGGLVVSSGPFGGRQVFCNACNAGGPVAATDDAAIAAWNRRSTPPAPERSDAVEAVGHTRSCPQLGGSDDACTCGLEWRIKLRTEQEMHAAWRKRAEEAERALSTPPAPASEVALLGSLSDRDAPSDEHSMPHVANHADIALQDCMHEWLDQKTGEKIWLYDPAKFLASMRGNGYEITAREPDARGEARPPAPASEAVEELGSALPRVSQSVEHSALKALLQLAYAAWCLADDSEDLGDGFHKIDHANFVNLCDALDLLDELPDDQPGYVMESAAKAWPITPP
jgi:hypothetical protein